jgi:hypothetical protein
MRGIRPVEGVLSTSEFPALSAEGQEYVTEALCPSALKTTQVPLEQAWLPGQALPQVAQSVVVPSWAQAPFVQQGAPDVQQTPAQIAGAPDPAAGPHWKHGP